MGWTYHMDPYESRKDFIADRTKTQTNCHASGSVRRWVCLAHCFRGNTFAGNLWKVWMVEERLSEEAEWREVDRFIALDLVHFWKNNGWGYKDLEETMGPNELSCPLKYLEMVPCPNSEYARKWREEVREYWAKRRDVGRLADGAIIEFAHAIRFTDGHEGNRFKVKKTGRRFTFHPVSENAEVAWYGYTIRKSTLASATYTVNGVANA